MAFLQRRPEGTFVPTKAVVALSEGVAIATAEATEPSRLCPVSPLHVQVTWSLE